VPDGPESGPSGTCAPHELRATVWVDFKPSNCINAREDTQMIGRLRILGIALGVIGLGFVVVGGYAFFKVQEGTSSLKAFSTVISRPSSTIKPMISGQDIWVAAKTPTIALIPRPAATANG